MEFDGQYSIRASKMQLWLALRDPDFLRQCIPGCQEIKQVSKTSFLARVKIHIGPINATFNVEMNIEDVDMPDHYIIRGRARAPGLGQVVGSSDVSIQTHNEMSELKYTVTAVLSGKLAQLAQRLIDSATKALSREFFTNLQKLAAEGRLPNDPKDASLSA